MSWGRILSAIAGFSGALACGRAPAVGAAPAGCRPDLRLLLGACVPPAVAAKSCGAEALATADGCSARRACEPGRARDLGTGQCLGLRDVRALATSLGIRASEDEILHCRAGGELVTATLEDLGPRLGCLSPPEPRPRACAAGSVPDALGGCIRVAEGGQLDVARWLAAAIGPDGGPAALPLCGALRRSRGALAVAGPADVRIHLALSFPDNDVSLVTARIDGAGAAMDELEQVVAPLIEALRSFGGTANQASIATAVHCRRTSERPVALFLEEGPSEIR